MEKLKNIILKKKTKNKKEKDTVDPLFSDENAVYDDIFPPLEEETSIQKELPINVATRWIFSKDTIKDLPIQHASNRRMQDLDDDEYGYTTRGAMCNKPKKDDLSLEFTFVDALEFYPYKHENPNPMINRVFSSPQGNYGEMSVAKISEEMSLPSTDYQGDLKKFITVQLFPSLKFDNRIAEVFTLLSCKNFHVRSLCTDETTEMILDINYRHFSRDHLMNLYESGTVHLFAAITETKKSLLVFPSLIQLGIMFNCFIYLNAIQAIEDWIPRIQRVKSTVQSKSKRMFERNDPDVEVFAKTVKCIFDLENVNLDDSLILGEDLDDFLPEFSKGDGDIYIEGLAGLFHTGNLILRQQSKLTAGVEKLVEMSSIMNRINDDGIVKWFHRLLEQFVVRILQQEHPDVKQDVLDRCEDKLFSLLTSDTFHSNAFSHCLLFHHNESIRTRYRDIARTKGVKGSHAVTDIHIQGLLKKCGLSLDLTKSQSNGTLERKHCRVCDVDASITCFYESFQEESMDDCMYDNTSPAKLPASENKYKKENLENELEVLKEIESKHFHLNVARLIAFSQSLPKFYIKEGLPGHNLQKRLLKAREKGKIIPIVDLIRIIIQAVKAVIYVHSQGCLLREITTASYGCTVSDKGYFLKLKNFEVATKASDLSDDGIVSGLIDLDCKGVPTRWASPESLLEGHYSIYSDVWSVNILADEILNYAAWPYSDISDADINDIVTHIVFTHLKPQGFNRPRRVQSLILEGLATLPEKRLKLEALKKRLLEILNNIDGEDSYSLYDTYNGVEGTRTRTYNIPPITERQKQANSVFERGIPASIQKYRELEDPVTVFAMEVAENNSRLKVQTGLKLMEICSDEKYKIESEDTSNKMKVMERVTEDFLKFTYNKLNEIDSSKMCIQPWPPSKSAPTDGFTLHYRFPRSTHLLDVVLHKDRGESIGFYIQLLYELANHVDAFHTAGWIFRCLRAKNVWILDTKKREQNIVVPKFGKYRMIVSSEISAHLEQIKIDSKEDMEDVQWLPIEAIKAGLYSKESDVYAFGMVTWEVMTAFGQEGVVYDQDEERELSCIPFNYQQSENILQHLIEGYIPEKPVKCPDWFYQEITRPCLLHQKIDRPSMKTVLQILEKRLGRTLPPQILSLPPLARGTSYDSDDRYNDIYNVYEDLTESPDPISVKPRSNDKSAIKPVNDVKVCTSVAEKKSSPPPNINIDSKDRHNDGHRRLQSQLPPISQESNEEDSDTYDHISYDDISGFDDSLSDIKDADHLPENLYKIPSSALEKSKDSYTDADINNDYDDAVSMRTPFQSKFEESKTLSEEKDTGDHAFVKRRPPPPIPLSDYDKDGTESQIAGRQKSPSTSREHFCKKKTDTTYRFVPPVPCRDIDTTNLQVQESEADNGRENCPPVPTRPQTVVLSENKKESNDMTEVNICKPLPLLLTPTQSSDDNDTKDQFVSCSHLKPISPIPGSMKDALNSVKHLPLPPRPPKPNCKNDMISGSKPRPVSNSSVDSVYKGSDFDVTAPDVLYEDLRDTFKGSDFNCSENVSIGLGDTHKGSDFNSSANLNDNNIESDIEDTHLSVEPASLIKANPEDFSKTKPKFNSYVNVDVPERKSDKSSHSLMYVNQNQPETKPAVPPRKPLN